jgi:adenosine/AMP kinase
MEDTMLEIKSVRMEVLAEANIIVGQSHFIKTVEDLYEAVTTTVPQARFGLAFNESSGACLTRLEGNDPALRDTALRNAQALGCGHTFVLMLQNAYPINVLNAIRNVPEVCSIFCATANPVEIVIAESEQGRGVLGVIDGSSPKGVESQTDIAWRHDLLRKIGYKR